LAKDIIVIAGWTTDNAFSRGAKIFVAAFSISSTTIYWAKGDKTKSDYLPISISLSPNANFVIVLINKDVGSSIGFV
jgi:hypothetical protein